MKEKVYLDQVMAGEIIIDHDRQRELLPALIAHLRKTYDEMALGVIYLSKRGDGLYHCMDGQHRVTVATEQDPTIIFNALVFDGLTPERESELFIKFNEGRRSVSSLHKWQQHLGFEDPVYVELEEMLHRHGLDVAQNASNNRIAAISKMLWLHKRFGLDSLELAIETLSSAWPRTGDSWKGTLLGAVTKLIYMNPQINLHNLAEILRVNEPHVWDHMRTGGGTGMDGDIKIAEAIAVRYNKAKRGRNRIVLTEEES